MAAEWREIPFADAIEIVSGGTPKTTIQEYWDGDMPWLSVADFNTDYRWVSDAEKHISERGLAESATTLLNQGDIIISARGTVGVVAQLTRPMAFNQSCYGIRGKKDIADTDFIYYSLRKAVANMKQVAHGGVFDTITRDTFKILQVSLPPVPEQRAIAHILGTLDDKIELNRRTSGTLEAMSRALFKSWFIDFDPVRRNAARSRNQPSPRPPSHPSPIGREVGGEGVSNGDAFDHLFPDRLVNSELGKIPEGWKVKTIGDLAEVVGGGTPSTGSPEYWDDGIHHWVTPKDLSSVHVPVLLETERKVTDAGLARISSGLLPVGTVLLSSRAPIGYLAIAEVPVAINQGFIAMKHREGVPSVYLLLWARVNHEEILSRANGSTFMEISKSNFRPIPAVIAPPEVLAAFERLATPCYQRLVTNVRESRTQATLRDTLLPKLISGELRVKDAAMFFGTAT